VSDPRAIIHLDLDAFFAAVEVLENTALAGRPVIVGGSPEGRGVVCAASYPARAFGIHSAMPTGRALALCPHAVVLPARHRLYRTYSKRVMALLHETSPLVEQMSIDEAFLDVTDQAPLWEEAIDIARRLQARVMEQVGLSASLGVASNKLVAKIASDLHKPGGLTVVRPGEEAAFLAPLPVRALWGVGPVTAQRLAKLGVSTVGQLAQVPEGELRTHFGRQGGWMARQTLGIDSRPVITQHEAKSVSHERTFSRDLANAAELELALLQMSQGVSRRLQRLELAAATISLKLRYSDFTTLSRQMTLDCPTDDERQIYGAALVLFQRTWRSERPVRLLGVGASSLRTPLGQLPLW
jgi:DNA polymerase-4